MCYHAHWKTTIWIHVNCSQVYKQVVRLFTNVLMAATAISFRQPGWKLQGQFVHIIHQDRPCSLCNIITFWGIINFTVIYNFNMVWLLSIINELFTQLNKIKSPMNSKTKFNQSNYTADLKHNKAKYSFSSVKNSFF